MKTLIQERKKEERRKKRQKRIDYVYEHKQKLSSIFHSENNTFDHSRVFFDDNDESYIRIQQSYGNIICNIVLVGGKLKHYNFIDTDPKSKEYISTDKFLKKLVKEIKKHKN